VANKELEKNINGFSEEVYHKFCEYSWPGNLREMKNVIKRGVLLTKGELIEVQALPEEITNPMEPQIAVDVERLGISAQSDLKNVQQRMEKEMILNALQQFKYNKSKVAKALNIDRKTLYNKLKLYEIED